MKINRPCTFCGENITFDTYDCRYGSSDYPAIIYSKSKRGTITLAHRDCYFNYQKGVKKEHERIL